MICIANRNPIQLHSRAKTKVKREEWQHCKDEWKDCNDHLERAAKWFYMLTNSVHCKGHSYARGTHSVFNSFYGLLDDFRPVHRRLRGIQIENLDFRQTFKDYDQQDCVHYFDPPYLDTDQGTYEHKFHQDDMNDLLHLIKHSKGSCYLSHYEHPQLDRCTFWTKVESWEVSSTSEVTAFTDENHKSHMKNLIGKNYPKECLYIKE